MHLYLWHWKAQLGQLHRSDQWDSDSVGQYQITADNVLNQTVREATVNTRGEVGMMREGRKKENKQNEAINYLKDNRGALGL